MVRLDVFTGIWHVCYMPDYMQTFHLSFVCVVTLGKKF